MLFIDVHRGWRILMTYEDKVDVITPINMLFIDVHRGWRILMTYEDKVDVITPINMLFRAGGKF